MTVESPTKKKKTVAVRESWKQWMAKLTPDARPPIRLLRRSELLDLATANGVDIDEARLRYWEFEGVLPQSVLKWDPSARGRVALYPEWFIPLLFALQEMRRVGLSLHEIAGRIRYISPAAIYRIENHDHVDEDNLARLKTSNSSLETQDKLKSKIDETPPGPWQPSQDREWLDVFSIFAFWPPVANAIGAYARRYNQVLEDSISQAKVVYLDREGRELPFGTFLVNFEHDSWRSFMDPAGIAAGIAVESQDALAEPREFCDDEH